MCFPAFLRPFDIFQLMPHAFAHDECAAALHVHIAREACVAVQFKCAAVAGGHIAGGIGIMPVIFMRIALGAAAVERPWPCTVWV